MCATLLLPVLTTLTPCSTQTEMMRLEQVVQTIHLELQNIRRKEERMRDVNGALACCGHAALHGWEGGQRSALW